MKLSAPTILLATALANLVPAGLESAQSLIRSSQESEQMTSVPIDWRYRMPRTPESIDWQSRPVEPTIAAKSPRIVVDGR